MNGLIAVHCGAGFHKDSLHHKYNRLSRIACRAGIRVLKNGGTALEACQAAVVVLENDAVTNAGYGSNLTIHGEVECDASLMDGKSLNFGGCGAVKGVKNPISLAYDLCTKQSATLPLGLIPPSLLVGNGGLVYAKTNKLATVNRRTLISPKAFKSYKKYKRLLKQAMETTADMVVVADADERMDTVGAVCIDLNGQVASACSSGGICLKHPGRVGQAAVYGSGVWADSFNTATTNEPSVAVCTTGCGEYLVQTQLARVISEDLKSSTCPVSGLCTTMTDKFLNSKFLHNVKIKLGGALVLHLAKEEGSLLWGHSTATMAIGYMQTTDKKPMSMVSKLPVNVPVGSKINVGGISFTLERPQLDK